MAAVRHTGNGVGLVNVARPCPARLVLRYRCRRSFAGLQSWYETSRRLTQPPTLRGIRNEYRPRGSVAGAILLKGNRMCPALHWPWVKLCTVWIYGLKMSCLPTPLPFHASLFLTYPRREGEWENDKLTKKTEKSHDFLAPWSSTILTNLFAIENVSYRGVGHMEQ